MIRLTDVVKNIIIINVLLYLAVIFMPPMAKNWLIFHYPGANADGVGFQPLQIVTHMFMHAQDGKSIMSMHLLFNMFGLAIFGPRLEALWGPKRFFFYYMFAGLGALLTHVIFNYYEINFMGGVPSLVLGASGAVAGVALAFAYNFFDQQLRLIFPPISVSPVIIVGVFLTIDLYAGLTGSDDGVAHFAHLGGALFGFLLIKYWQKFGSKL